MWLLFLCFLESLHVAADNGSCTGTSMRTTLRVALTIQKTSEIVNHTSRRRGEKLERPSLKRETDPKWIKSHYSVKIYRTHRPVILAKAEVHTFSFSLFFSWKEMKGGGESDENWASHCPQNDFFSEHMQDFVSKREPLTANQLLQLRWGGQQKKWKKKLSQ